MIQRETEMKHVLRCSLVLVIASLLVAQAASGGMIVVTSTADSGEGSLRWAIELSQSPGPDSIHFAIPLSDPGCNITQGTWTIRPVISFWGFTDGQTVVDGSSQAKFIGGDPNPYGPEIEINGEAVADLPIFCALAPEVIFRELTINQSKFSAIMFDGVHGGGVFGCYLGTTYNGMNIAGNQFGVSIHNGSRNLVIGDSQKPEDGNLICGNEAGIFINGSCARISIIGNRIGTNRVASDTLGGQEAGIAVHEYCDSVFIFDNLIGGNRSGIIVSNSTHTMIETNLIGTDEAWSHRLGNSVFGILCADSAHDNRIADNAIAYNGVSGIRIAGDGTVRNHLMRNLMSNNGSTGIRLEVGGNAGLTAPTIVSVTSAAITGTAGPGNTVELFVDSASEGRYYCGTVQAESGGDFRLSLASPITMPHVTATATDANGNTSEFSNAFPAGSAYGKLLITTTADTGVGSLRWAIGMTTVPGPDSIHFAISVSDPGYNAAKGTWTIKPLSTLWAFTDGHTIVDGTTQAQFIGGDPNPYGPEIEINAELLTASSALVALAPEVAFKGLTVNHARYSALQFNGVQGGGVFGCYLGTTSDGMSAAGNEFGVWILGHSRDIQIGNSEDPAAGNLISGNNIGICVQDSCAGVSVVGCRIGTNRSGTDTIGNKYAGIGAYGLCDSIAILNNLIGGNTTGIELVECASSQVVGNSVGTDLSWTHAIGNKESGIYVENSHDNHFADNAIANNRNYGVFLAGNAAIHNRLSRNLISRNWKKGIKLTNMANEEESHPSIVSVTTSSVSGTASPGHTVELFADDSLEARYFIGSTVTNANGDFVLSIASPITQMWVTATATDSSGNTSELADAFLNTTLHVCANKTPDRFGLLPNYPNPFNSATTIRYTIGVVSGQPLVAGKIRLTVYDLLGREVEVLVNEQKEPGYYTVTWNASRFASGVYYARLQSGDKAMMRKMLLVR
jgi:parallel beta-helix repeat protein